LGGSEHNGSTRDERGTLIPFPRSGWIPADGIEPLNTEAPQPSSTSEAGSGAQEPGAEPRARSATIEADDFWASGDTQEFVGVASAANGSPAAPLAGAAGVRSRSARPHAFVGLAAAVVMAIAGVAAWQLSSSTGGSAKRSADFSASARHRPSVTSAAETSGTESGLQTDEGAQLHRSTFVPRTRARVNRTARHRAKPVHHEAASPQFVPVSYEAPSPATSSSNASPGSSPAASGSPRSTSASTASASGGSVSSSSAPPPQPGPNGALTCISNCG